MRIISWNCNGAFRNKINSILSLNGDIYVIQEAEDPNKNSDLLDKLNDFNFLWTGINKNKGLLVFSKKNILINKLKMNIKTEKYFLPVKINNSFNILACWLHKDSEDLYYDYIGQFYKFLLNNIEYLNQLSILIGDFNSNIIFDYRKEFAHAFCSKILKDFNLYSAYHILNNIQEGKEKDFTFYLYRKIEKAYYIDYCFLNKSILNNFKIGNFNNYICYSDHLPIIVDFDETLIKENKINDKIKNNIFKFKLKYYSDDFFKNNNFSSIESIKNLLQNKT